MNTNNTHLIIGTIALGVAIAAAYYFYKNPDMKFGALRATGGGCPCTYTFTPNVYHEYGNIPPGNPNAIHTNVTAAQMQSLCDAEPDCKGFIYDPVLQAGYLKGDVSSPKPWIQVGLYSKNG